MLKNTHFIKGGIANFCNRAQKL